MCILFNIISLFDLFLFRHFKIFHSAVLLSIGENGCTVPLGGVSSMLLISQKPTGKMEGEVLW